MNQVFLKAEEATKAQKDCGASCKYQKKLKTEADAAAGIAYGVEYHEIT